ncbi:NAD-dependent DNA ligase LigA [Mycoplasma sp. Mirounga ES2805-ORL]|uniref:NAD-dependent DNA ligase LigA n=1 Tax=Mycoplasma sp. Mirounga ES2805-ORL TaxID=754514 RepID=UPI00197B2F04|nr:NAD-dependent DNA ligase LigA [Mycoplasma sp. Mirounga ES2805-ORL]QSF13719.1 NAD-dependent DNA ligase LigA [Mycoplasma sp. Mirounga ES2805-ORL]
MEKNKEIKDEIKRLVDLINKWDEEYFIENNPSVSDLEYDKNYYKLEKLENEYPELVLSNSPTKKVGSKSNNSNLNTQKFRHEQPMLSLSKAYHYDEVAKFIDNINKNVPIEDINFSIEPKIDGLSISLHYDNGILVRAVTRGDGIEGEDVTTNVKKIKTVPQNINYKDKIEIRGEVFLPKQSFEKINDEIQQKNKEILFNNAKIDDPKKHKKLLKLFANPRNAASGTLRQLDSDVVEERNLQAFLYELVQPEKHNIHFQDEALKFIESLGLPINKSFGKIIEVEQLEEEIENFSEIKNNLEYDADGLVIKLNNLKYWKKLGKTAKFPKHSIAFKYDVEVAYSIIKNIKTSIGRTGKVTYIANLEPVELNQTIVQNATLHNYNFIKSLNLNIGDEVKIVKAGEIIPKVLELVSKNSEGTFEKITKCSSCYNDLVEIEDNVDQFCVNPNCDEIKINSIYHFSSRKALNIAGLGLTTVQDLYKANLITRIQDIFELQNHIQQIKELPRYADLKINNLLNSIEGCKTAPFHKVLFALGIKHMGERAAKLFAKKYSSFSEMINNKNFEDMELINNIGPKIIESVIEYFNKEDNIELMQYLDSIFDYSKNKNDLLVSTKFENINFVITGKLNNSRDWYVEIIEKNSGHVSSSISKNTNYLILGENAGSKLEKAKALNVKIITEDDFEKLLGEGNE